MDSGTPDPMGTDTISRRKLVIAIAGGVLLPKMSIATDQSQKPSPISAETVKAFVGAAHGDLDKTKQMLSETPALLNATWDWGGGDFESAIGGAGHMGRRDIAEFLLSKGARMDVFVAAMLGKIEIVKATLGAYPELKDSKGPHGIPLMVHAEKGGENSKAVVEYLKLLG